MDKFKWQVDRHGNGRGDGHSARHGHGTRNWARKILWIKTIYPLFKKKSILYRVEDVSVY